MTNLQPAAKQKEAGLYRYEFVDLDWDDDEPLIFQATDPVDAARKYYTETLLEPAPEMDAKEITGGILADSRPEAFNVTDEDGAVFAIYLS